MIKGKSYTFFIASTPGKLRKLIIPAYELHGVAVLALIGMVTVIAAAGSYSRMLWKVGNYNAVRQERDVDRGGRFRRRAGRKRVPARCADMRNSAWTFWT